MKRREFLTLGLIGIGALAAGRLPSIPAAPAEVTWAIIPEGTFLVADGGTLDLGIVRDSILNSTNDFEIFAETFEGAAVLPPMWITSTV
jgi:hypothetical protein